jgi:hypothetical protein
MTHAVSYIKVYMQCGINGLHVTGFSKTFVEFSSTKICFRSIIGTVNCSHRHHSTDTLAKFNLNSSNGSKIEHDGQTDSDLAPHVHFMQSVQTTHKT